MLALWTGDENTIKAIEVKIINFLWAGQLDSARHKVDHLTVIRPKNQDGLGVLSLSDQVKALLGKTMVWTVSEKPHPLHTILKHRICELFMKCWGIPNFSWVFYPCKTLPTNASPICLNLYHAWNDLKTILFPVHLQKNLIAAPSPYGSHLA